MRCQSVWLTITDGYDDQIGELETGLKNDKGKNRPLKT